MANSDRLCPLLAAITFNRVCTMAGCVDADVWTNEAIITNSNTGFIENREIEVGKKLANMLNFYIFTSYLSKIRKITSCTTNICSAL